MLTIFIRICSTMMKAFCETMPLVGPGGAQGDSLPGGCHSESPSGTLKDAQVTGFNPTQRM
jgi:hypothetical protein